MLVWRCRGTLCAILALVGCASALAAATTAAARPEARAKKHVVVIGALLDLSAGWTALGAESRVALKAAVADANRDLKRRGAPYRVRLRIRDVAGSPTKAVTELKRLARLDARIVVGPESSAEVKAVRTLANHLGVLVVSQGSTASELSIARDEVLRLVPDDVQETVAMSGLLEHDGIEGIVPVWRDDTGNAGLATSLRAAFGSAGHSVATGVSYPTDAPDFAAVVTALSTQVSQSLAMTGPGKTGVYLAGFDEVVGLLTVAAADPVLASVPWYGSDGVALSPALLADPAAAGFAATVGYPNPILGLDGDAEARSEELRTHIEEVTGARADAFGLAAYDALRIGVRALIGSRGGGPVAVRKAFVKRADGYEGMSGRIELNAAGDRAFGPYDFWSVCAAASPATGFEWTRTFSFASTAPGQGTIVERDSCGSAPGP